MTVRGWHLQRRDYFAQHPEWWALVLSAGAWIALPMLGQSHHAMAKGSTLLKSDAWEWALMTAAMMVPLTTICLQTVALRSFWKRRHQAMAWFLAAYLTSWVAAGMLLSAAFRIVQQAEESGALLLSLAFITAALWELCPMKTWALRQCHRTYPLAAVGWRADWACLHFGIRHGLACIESCWALMLVPVAMGHSLPGMAGVGVIALAGRSQWERKPRILAAGLLACAAAAYLAGSYRLTLI
jgi:predicted metal-binding membrane protein